jgi:hypothetical protein
MSPYRDGRRSEPIPQAGIGRRLADVGNILVTRCPLLVGAARDGDGGFGLGPGAAHVEAAVAAGDVVAAQQSGLPDAARYAFEHFILRQGEDDGGRTGDQIDIGLRRLAVRFGEQLIGETAASAPERDLARVRMCQIDHVRRGLPDPQAVDLPLELVGEVVAAVGARGRGGEGGKRKKRGGKQGRSAKWSSQCHGDCPLALIKRPRADCARAGFFSH